MKLNGQKILMNCINSWEASFLLFHGNPFSFPQWSTVVFSFWSDNLCGHLSNMWPTRKTMNQTLLSMHVVIKFHTDHVWSTMWRNPVLHALLPNLIILDSNTRDHEFTFPPFPFTTAPFEWFMIPIVAGEWPLLQISTPYIAVQLRLLHCSLISHSWGLHMHGFFGNPIRMFWQLCFLHVGTLGAGLTDSSPPPQPPWHARALTYILVLMVLHFFMPPMFFFIHTIILHRSDWVLWPTVALALTSVVQMCNSSCRLICTILRNDTLL